MKSTNIVYIFLGIIAMLLWQSFLIQRDDKLFKAYYHEKAKVEQQKLIK